MVGTLALNLTFSPGEKGQRSRLSGFANDRPANPAAGFRVRLETILLLLGGEGRDEDERETDFKLGASVLCAPGVRRPKTARSPHAREAANHRADLLTPSRGEQREISRRRDYVIQPGVAATPERLRRVNGPDPINSEGVESSVAKRRCNCVAVEDVFLAVDPA